ncbi:MAG TPA: metallopeptidase TldD-related protein [Bryobacteraceae bacterium]|nr:metallopeptidase TldD-related protein [Bryobacteraceae bacterium]
MKFLLPAAVVLAAGFAIRAQAPATDPLIQAMNDEIAHSRNLSVSNLEKPYFVQYLLDDSDTFSVSATLGAVVSRRRDRFRQLTTQVRVGDYQFDNTNYVASGFNFGTRYDLGRFPVDDSYPVLRRYLWLSTDSAYKSAVEAISRKQAALRNLSVNERIADFAHAEPVHMVESLPVQKIDEKAWTDRIRRFSGIFDRYPEVRSSTVDLDSSEGGYYVVNSEGTQVRVPDSLTFVRVRANAQAPDGMNVRDAVMFQARESSGLPPEAEMTRGIQALAENVVALAHAPKGEDYSGPILFEGVAGAQIFAEVLGKNLALPRRPVMEPGRPGSFSGSELEGRIGARVLPDSFDVVDDPTPRDWHSRPLFGSYEVDREGVKAVPVRVIEKGLLKNYLLTRDPVRGFPNSNGRARLPGSFGAGAAGVSNLFVNSSGAVPVSELKKKLLEMIVARDKPYGIIVRKIDFPSSASFEEARRRLSGSVSDGSRLLSLPILVYRVYPDGREELVRGLRFGGLNARSLKDVVAAGDDPAAFDFMDNTAPFDLMGGAGYASNACVIAPSVLIDDLELHPVDDELPKPPVVPAPELIP